MTSYTTIENFSMVPHLKNTIYVLDIDETLLYYEGMNEKWWEKTMIEMMKIYDTFEEADYEANELWYRVITKIKPVITDPSGFIQLRQFIENKKNNCYLIFLTARLEKYKEITEKDLNDTIPKFKYQVLYSKKFPDNKGTILQNYFNENPLIFNSINDIVFVDDKERNLKNMIGEHPNSKCFLYKHPDFFEN